MFSLLWSEHCAYKHSKKLLRTLPTEGPRVVMGPGENAGAVDVGGGLAVAFKVESHNHPSAVEPFQGAATGVGGILRDIFAIGARPIAVLDSLRFGEPDVGALALPARPRGRRHRPLRQLDRRARRSAARSTSRRPTRPTAWSTRWRSGLARAAKLIRSAAAGVGNVAGPVRRLDRPRRDRRRVGAGQRRARRGRRGQAPVGPGRRPVRGEQAAGVLAGAAGARAARRAAGPRRGGPDVERLGDGSKGGVGIDIDVSKVPLREADMEPFEIMVSESQERMLCVCAPERVDEVLALTDKWEVHGTAIGEVTDTGRMRVYDGDRLVGDMPVAALVDDCPLYDLEPAASRPSRSTRAPVATLGAGRGPARVAAGAARVAEHRLAPAAVRAVRLPGAVAHRAPARAGRRRGARACPRRRRGVAVSIDCNGRRVAADPYRGTVEAALECASNLACVGAEPLGTTNNLNFGNPEKPHIAWQLTEAVRGLGDACRALEAPIVGGNVSLYNEGADGPIYPTPVVGMVGAAARRRARRAASASPARATRSARRLEPRRRRWRRPSWPSCAASRCPTGCRRSTSSR